VIFAISRAIRSGISWFETMCLGIDGGELLTQKFLYVSWRKLVGGGTSWVWRWRIAALENVEDLMKVIQ
jgi:hypothetical protein